MPAALPVRRRRRRISRDTVPRAGDGGSRRRFAGRKPSPISTPVCAHTDCIVTRDEGAAAKFFALVIPRASIRIARRALPTVIAMASARRSAFRPERFMRAVRWGWKGFARTSIFCAGMAISLRILRTDAGALRIRSCCKHGGTLICRSTPIFARQIDADWQEKRKVMFKRGLVLAAGAVCGMDGRSGMGGGGQAPPSGLSDL